MSLHVLHKPPRALREARLDNVALVPGNLLPYKDQWQAIANELPEGSVLICMPPTGRPPGLVLERVLSQELLRNSRLVLFGWRRGGAGLHLPTTHCNSLPSVAYSF